MSWVNSYDSLYDAIISSTGSNINKNIVRAEINNAWTKGGIKGVEALAESYGVEAHGRVINSAGQQFINWWSVGETAPVGTYAPSVYQEALEVNTIASTEDTIVLRSLPAVADKGIGSGAVQTFVKWAPIVGAVATGVGLGVKSYKDYPVMWSDISDAIFSANFNDLVKIMCRANAGEYKTYIKEDDVASVISALAYKDVFNVNSIISKIPSDTPSDTEIDVNFANIGLPETPAGVFGYNYYLSLAPTHKILGYTNYVDTNNEEILQFYSIENNNLPTKSIVKKDTYNTYYTEVYNCRFYNIVVDLTTGSLKTQFSDIRKGSIYSGYNIRIHSNYNTYVVGGLNSEVINKQGSNPIFYYPENTNALENITSDMSVTDILDKLKSKYNDWFDDNFEITGYNPETSEFITENFIPLTLPTQDPTIQDINDNEYNQEYVQKGIPKQDNNLQTETLLNNPPKVEPIPSPDDTPNDNGGGIIGGSGVNGLWSVYNPTKEELNNLGAYLWSSNIIEILQKFLNNPMDCIISLHLIYGTPTTGNNQNIKLGYLDSGVSSKVVTEQFINIDCGSLFINEYYGDSRDYEDIYTQIECFLPFIGFVKLQSNDIINSKVNIKYVIDVLSGVITAKIYITKNGATQQLYTYSGDCSIQIPLTSSDRTRLLSGAITGAIGGFATGGVAGAIIGAGVGSYMGGSNITKSGNFNGNSGALNVKKPYIIISRKIPYDANNYNELLGYPSNESILLKNCNGFTRVKECFTDNIINATYSEKNEIKELLKNGIII